MKKRIQVKNNNKKGKDGTVSVARSPPKTVYENNWNYKHALSVVFHSNSSPESSIIIFINGVRFSSECKNKLFSLEIFLPTSFLVPSNGIQESEDMSEYRRKKKIPTCKLRSSRHYSMSLVRNKWRIQETPVFCTLAAVYSRLLAT